MLANDGQPERVFAGTRLYEAYQVNVGVKVLVGR
ncbi:hypothetical protein EV664_103133 [Stakelama pacifica]|uniref:Uncharacterized protein n=1 Tax=Stakelama pacifica TaxID=517720 RepID=A0A4R6FTG2_9SPHN|nr:hypothetical protein EV664_103133 [Stakelama pacifica]